MKFMAFVPAILEWLAGKEIRTRRVLWGLAIGLPYLVVLLLALVILWPRRHITIQTGTAGGTYAVIGAQIADQLHQEEGVFGHTVYEPVPSAGDYENISAIDEGKADVAFAADGLPINTNKIRCLVPV